MAGGGDSVAVDSGKLYVNDALVEEAYVDYPGWSDYARRVLGENEYMVMGTTGRPAMTAALGM